MTKELSIPVVGATSSASSERVTTLVHDMVEIAMVLVRRGYAPAEIRAIMHGMANDAANAAARLVAERDRTGRGA